MNDDQVAFWYGGDNYPENPNGSERNVAGICNYNGLVVGMMPHPENAIHDWQHPVRIDDFTGLPLFKALVDYLEEA